MSVTIKDDISLAQWALVEEVHAGKWKTLDFAKIARQDFDLNGIEYVNTLMDVPTEEYLKKLKKHAEDFRVTNVLIMVDDEGDGCMPTKEGRRQFDINHRKWIDIAGFLGCKSIRTNCRGPQNVDKHEALKWATESYHLLLEYAVPAQVNVLIENHGGVSNDPDFIVSLMQEVDHPCFGTNPDYRYLQKTLPFAQGMSYRNQPTDELTVKMIHLAKRSGYRGWYGIESSGREAITKGKELLNKYLMGE
jgi:L-ribulose-5-phosphate 3-epimerase